ncbi:MAG: hypothetical protein A2Z02_00520 [Chloroflexi bacterium RBG_16_48_7]|nr:MAG: hypothetical protein A2Z02_00520 [Chloroflexi bacterium RBG_16_48_7]
MKKFIIAPIVAAVMLVLVLAGTALAADNSNVGSYCPGYCAQNSQSPFSVNPGLGGFSCH